MVSGNVSGMNFSFGLVLAIYVLNAGVAFFRNSIILGVLLERKSMGNKKNKLIFSASVILWLVIDIVIEISDNPNAVYDDVLFFILIFLYPMVLTVNYKGTLKRKMMSSLVITFVSLAVTSVFATFHYLTYSNEVIFLETYAFPFFTPISSFILNHILLTGALIFKWSVQGKEYVQEKKFNTLYYISLAINVISIFIMYYYIDLSSSFHNYIAYISFAFFLLSVLLINYVFDIAYKRLISREERKHVKAHLAFQSQQYEKDKGYLLDIKKMLHDLNKHMSVIKQAIGENENEYAMDYIDQAFGKMTHFYGSSYSGNFVIDTLVYNLLKQCEKQNITFTYNFDLSTQLSVTDQDIVAIFGNLFENAVEASEQIEHPWIDVNVYTRNKHLVILVKNKKGDFTKKERSVEKIRLTRGLGLKNVRQAVEKYDGLMTIENSEKEFFAKVIIPPQ